MNKKSPGARSLQRLVSRHEGGMERWDAGFEACKNLMQPRLELAEAHASERYFAGIAAGEEIARKAYQKRVEEAERWHDRWRHHAVENGKVAEELASCLRVVHTWASFEGGRVLTPDDVVAQCLRGLRAYATLSANTTKLSCEPSGKETNE